MKQILLRFVLVLSLLPLAAARAESTPELQNLNRGQADAILKNFGNAMVFRSLEPPSANGTIFGVAVGVVGAATSASDVNDALGAAKDISAVPAADLVLVGQAPLGLALELGILPEADVSSFTFERRAFNLRWTFTEVFLREHIPFDAALRFGLGNQKFSYEKTISGVQDRIDFRTKSTRLELAVSRKFLFVEPYAAIGLLKTANTLGNANNAVPLYSFTPEHSYTYRKSSFLFNLGAEVRLALLAVSAELDWAFGETTAGVKLGLKF